MLTPLSMPPLRDRNLTMDRCVMPINDADSLQETRLCGERVHTHRTILDVVCGLCARCAGRLDAEVLADATEYGLAVVFQSKSIGAETDLGAYFDRTLGTWTAPRYEVIDVERNIMLHRAITREEIVAWLITYMENDDAAN